jgi:hypothetical protein
MALHDANKGPYTVISSVCPYFWRTSMRAFTFTISNQLLVKPCLHNIIYIYCPKPCNNIYFAHTGWFMTAFCLGVTSYTCKDVTHCNITMVRLSTLPNYVTRYMYISVTLHANNNKDFFIINNKIMRQYSVSTKNARFSSRIRVNAESNKPYCHYDWCSPASWARYSRSANWIALLSA